MQGWDRVKPWTFIPEAIRTGGKATVRWYRASRKPSHDTQGGQMWYGHPLLQKPQSRDPGDKWPDSRYVRKTEPEALSIGWA